MSEPSPRKIRAWLQLMRIANLPTAVANVLAGFLVGSLAWQPVELGCLILISCLMYCGGMVLNDAFDAEVDAVQRPERPIPAGEVTARDAFQFGFGLLFAGLILAVALGMLVPAAGSLVIWIAFGLAGAIVLYDGVLKRTPLAPVVMGSCRSLNVLLGGCTGFVTYRFTISGATDPFVVESLAKSVFNQRLLCFALGVGIFVCGITWLARNESNGRPSRMRIALSSITMITGLIVLGCLGWVTELQANPLIRSVSPAREMAFLIAIISLPVLRRLGLAIWTATPRAVGTAIVTSLNSLILIDAAVCFLERPDQPVYALVVAMLIVPVFLLRKLSQQT